MAARDSDCFTLRRAAMLWLGPGVSSMLLSASYPAMALKMLVDAAEAGDLELVDRTTDSPGDWVASRAALRAFAASRQGVPEFLLE